MDSKDKNAHPPLERRRTSLYEFLTPKRKPSLGRVRQRSVEIPTPITRERSNTTSGVTFSFGVPNKIMVKAMHITVAGPKTVGKTAILQQIAFLRDLTKEPYSPTMDDTYQVQMDQGDRPKEIFVFHDTAGISERPVQLKKPYIQVADAFILVYNITDMESFTQVDLIKKFIDKQLHTNKDKKEVPIVVLANKTDLDERKVDMEFALAWSQREKVKLYEVTATDRKTLVEPIVYLGSRLFHPPKESAIKFSLGRKLKPEKSGAAILMDI